MPSGENLELLLPNFGAGSSRNLTTSYVGWNVGNSGYKAIDSIFQTDSVVDTEDDLSHLRPLISIAEISSKHYLGKCAFGDPG